jgi:hypothetical protein
MFQNGSAKKVESPLETGKIFTKKKPSEAIFLFNSKRVKQYFNSQ